ncbi:MAG: VWA domain-containing protein [Sulfurovum sp.]|nr:MAG: VWA domain-containing protein [Sulfurovum sp.]
MKKAIFIMIIFGLSSLDAMEKKVKVPDEWEYNATQSSYDRVSYPSAMGNLKYGVMSGSSAMPNVKLATKNIGLSVGGAKDTNNFKENIERGFLPKLESITYEGEFYNYFFDTQLKGECKELFCPSYNSTSRINPFSKQKEQFLTIGLNSGIKEGDFKRKKLNLVVVLDISGSMDAPFDRYYYDNLGNKIENNNDISKNKMEIAKESIIGMMGHLKAEDRAGMVLFDDRAYKAHKLKMVKDIDKRTIKEHILEIQSRGGTNWSAGYTEGVNLFDAIKDTKEYENRIIFLTDAMPNSGQLNKNGLLGMAKEASEKSINTTFIGIGVDFNNDLVEYVSKIKGANYYSVHSSDKFNKLLDDEFDYMVTPLVYDLKLTMDSKAYAIDEVYGSPEANSATNELMVVNTLFPSKNSGEETKGGVILVKLKKSSDIKDDLSLKVEYKDVNGKNFTNVQKVKLIESKNSGINKAILLTDYVSVMKNFMIDSRASCNDSVSWVMQEPPFIMKRFLDSPKAREIYPTVATWERKSCKLETSKSYKKSLEDFKTYYKKEAKKIGDKSLNDNIKLIDKILKAPTLVKSTTHKKDEWNATH